MAAKGSRKIIGIDLGTTNSVVSVMEGDKPLVITNHEGSRITPSVLAFTEKGERLVGQLARRQSITNPTNTIYSIKRFMGRRHKEVAAEEKIVPYEIVGGPEEPVKVRVRGKDYTPPEISAMVLQNLKETAETYLGHEVTDAVISVPAYFNDDQRRATKDAGTIAGLNVRRVFPEPTAACLAYGIGKELEEKVAVFDLGGGTYDISIIEVSQEEQDGKKVPVFEVHSINGDTHLGGDDFDQVLMNYIASEFKKEQGIDLTRDQLALQRLKEAAEKAKCELSTSVETTISLPFITADQSGPKHLQMTITRAKFEQLVEHLLARLKQPCLDALKDAKLNPGDIDEIILVGGATRMPAVQQIVKDIFGKEPNRSVNPDEVVAEGAAIQADILASGKEGGLLLLDATPLSLGIETLGGVFTKLIERNTTIPTGKQQAFSTAEDSQAAVDINVLQGEREFARDNRSLGRFQLTGIPPAPRGLPQIEVSFDIDANGILNVSAKDMGTGKEQSIVIRGSSGLSEEEVERMSKEAELHAEEDKKRRELVEVRNSAAQLVYTTEKTLREHGSKLGEADRKSIDEALEKLKKVKDSESKEEIQRAMEELSNASQKIGRILYEEAAKAQAQTGAGPGAGAGGAQEKPEATKPTGEGEDKIIDADYEVKDECGSTS